MAGRRKPRKQEVSLFPFLDILACVIGNLILIITTVVLEQVDTKPVAEAARLEEVKEETKREQARVVELEQQLDALRERSSTAMAALDAVRRKIEEAKERKQAAEARVKPPPQAPPETPADLERLEAERARIEEEIKKVEQEIVERQRPPEQMIAVLPGGAGNGPRRGVFVEAARDGLVIHEGDKPWNVPTATIGADPRFKALLDGVKGDAESIVTFLVRPDGLASLGAGQRVAQAAGVRSGRVPLPGGGALDLSGARDTGTKGD
jgi:hypothetical protein